VASAKNAILLSARRPPGGGTFFLYLTWYPKGRFWVEMFRPDGWRIDTLATAQGFALAGIVLGVTGSKRRCQGGCGSRRRGVTFLPSAAS